MTIFDPRAKVTIEELANNANTVPEFRDIRRRPGNKHIYYAKYPNGDFFQGSGNGTPIFFKTKKGLLENIGFHASNLWDYYKDRLEDINSRDELYDKLLNMMEIVEL